MNNKNNKKFIGRMYHISHAQDAKVKKKAKEEETTSSHIIRSLIKKHL